MFRPDRPIQSCEDDSLGRRHFAESIAEAILKYEATDPLVVGLYGEWGSGKTSIINCIEKHIEKLTEHKPKAKKVILARFDPWNISDQNQLITQFFARLSVLLSKPDHSKQLKKAGDHLMTISKIFGTFSFVPIAGDLLKALSGSLEHLGGALKGVAKQLSQDLESVKHKLTETLARQPNKLLIVIDDIDRLNSTEVRQVFQLVKSLADFPNTIYLLAFDKKVIIDTLQEAQKGSPDDYLAKIVPVAFDVPLLDKNDLGELLEKQLKALIGETWERDTWSHIYSRHLQYFFRNIRDVNRYVNTFRFEYGILKDDVYLSDLLLITAVQVRVPILYDAIKNNKWIFADVYHPPWMVMVLDDRQKQEEAKEQARSECEELVRQSSKPLCEPALELLSEIFPRVGALNKDVQHGQGDLDGWARDRRICHRSFFDRYFRLSISRGQFWQKEIDSILLQADSLGSITVELERRHEQGQIDAVLEALWYTDPGKISALQLRNVSQALLDLGDTFSAGTGRPDPKFDSLFPIVESFVKGSSDSLSERCEILAQSIRASNRSLYTFVELIRGVGAQHKALMHGNDVDGMREELKPRELLVGAKDLKRLGSLVSNKVLESAEQGRLMSHPYVDQIFYDWHKWAEREEISEVVNRIAETDKGFLDFCSALVKSYFPDRVVEAPPGEFLNRLTMFLDREVIEQRMKSIGESRDFRKLDDRQKAVVARTMQAFERIPTNGNQGRSSGSD